MPKFLKDIRLDVLNPSEEVLQASVLLVRVQLSKYFQKPYGVHRCKRYGPAVHA